MEEMSFEYYVKEGKVLRQGKCYSKEQEVGVHADWLS